MVGGLLVSQVLTLYTTPVIYIFFDKLAQRITGRKLTRHAHDGELPPAQEQAMSISAPFIARPVATTLLTIAVAIAGAVAFNVLPVAPLPQVDYPTIAVSATLPGASARIMASSVATPLERQFGHIAGITEMTSSSSLGNTAITLQFDLNRDIDGAARDVESAINAARTYLPANLPQNPSYRKVNPSDSPIMIVSLTSDKYDVPKLYDLASTILQQKLSQIQGVGQVFVAGAAAPAVRVEANPTKLESYGLTLASIRSVLSLQNAHGPRGQIANKVLTADIITNDQISQAEDYKPLVVGYHNGTAVHLSDVADVVDGAQDLRVAGYTNTLKSVNGCHLPSARRQHYRYRRTHSRAVAISQGGTASGHTVQRRSGPHDYDSRFCP